MQIKSPLIITSRLMLGVKIGEGTISIEYAHRKEHRQYFRWFIDLPLPQARRGVRSNDNEEFQSDEFSVMDGSTLHEGLESLLSFLSAFAEACRNTSEYGPSENIDLFPAALTEWAIENADEFAVMECELQEYRGEFIAK